MYEKNKGCCCLCPSFVGVSIMFLIQTLVLVGFFALAFLEGVSDWPGDQKKVQKIFFLVGTISAMFIVPYFWVFFNKKSKCARLVLFIANILTWVAWLCAYRVLSFLLILHLDRLIDSKDKDVLEYDMNPNVNIAIDISGFAFLFTCMSFSVNCFYNFWWRKQYTQELPH